jgi:hypothetical protein
LSARVPQRSRAVGGRVAATSSTHALTADESAWLAALPAALALLALILVLGPPFGRALFAPPADTGIWRPMIREGAVLPEPTEHARYVIALLGPLLVAGGVLVLRGRSVSSRSRAALVRAGRAALIAFVAVCVVYQETHYYPDLITGEGPRQRVYFTPATLVVAIAIALLVAEALRRRDVIARLGRIATETTAKRLGVLAAAALYVLVWFLSAFNTDATIGTANPATRVNIPFWIDEAFAILNGQAPLVDFHAQYGQLWSYIGAGGMALLGTSFGVYSALMLTGTAGALAAVLATFRRVAGSSLAALALFLPFVATSFFTELGPPANRYDPANLYSLFPIRYGGPYLLLWLVVRRPQRPLIRQTLLFALAGLVVINNAEFGAPAFGATLAALLWTAPSHSPAALARLAASALAGLLGGIAAFAALTLVVAGSLPHFGMLAVFPEIFARDGLGMLPMPPLGLHLVLYLTFGAALVVATVRTVGGGGDPAQTASLAWAGVFGLGAGGYFVGRSHPDVLIGLFSAWALALGLLLVVVAQAIARRASRRPTTVELLVLAGFGAAVCSLAQTPTPWSQIDRLQHRAPHNVLAADTRLVQRMTHRGEPVAIMLQQGHRIAYDLELKDITPYSNMEVMVTHRQWEETIAALQAAHGRKIVVPQRDLLQERADWLQAAGYRPAFENGHIIVLVPR